MKFKKGQSGNPNGRPKGSADPTKELIRQLDSNPQKLQELIATLIDIGIGGNVKAIEHIFDRLNGKVTQSLSNPDGTPIVFQAFTPGMKGKS